MRKWYFIPIIVSIILLIMVGVANWCYPKGEPRLTGEYEEINDGNTVRPEIEWTPSPKTNPVWVRFFQDESDLLWICIIGLFIIAIYMRTSKVKTP